MCLARARPVGDAPLPALPSGGPPYPCTALKDWAGRAFELPPGDPRLPALHRGEPAPTPPLDNLVGAVRAWQDHPEWMEVHDPASPAHRTRFLERAIYAEAWAPCLPPGARVLELGAGAGRITTWLLDRGCAVDAVDPDLRSLWRLVAAAAGRPGRLDVHWTTAERPPEVRGVDAVVACEVLCYVEDPVAALRAARERLRAGGVLLASVEARWGWAMAPDAAPGTLDAFLGDGVVHVPGDRWVRTMDRADFEGLLRAGGFEPVEVRPTHYARSGPFEFAAPAELDARDLLALEERLRRHPVAAPLHRAWTAVARAR